MAISRILSRTASSDHTIKKLGIVYVCLVTLLCGVLIGLGYTLLSLFVGLVLPGLLVAVAITQKKRWFPLIMIAVITLEQIAPSWGEGLITVPKLGIAALLIGFVLVNGFPFTRSSSTLFLRLLAWAAFLALSIIWSEVPSATLISTSTLVFLMIAFWMIVEFINEQSDLLNFYEALVWMGLVSGVFSIYQSFWGVQSMVVDDPRTSGLIGNANENAYLITIGMVVLMANIIRPTLNNGIFKKLGVQAVALVTMGIGIVTTASRGGLLSLSVGLLTVLFFSYLEPTQNRKRIRLVTVALGVATTLVFTQGDAIDFINDRFRSIVVDSLSGRLEIYEVAWRVFLTSPVLGLGLSVFPYVYEQIAGRFLVVHNTYLSILVDGGIIAGVLFLGIIFKIAQYMKKISSSKTEGNLGNTILLSGLLLAMATMAFSGNLQLMKINWVIIGLAAGAYKLADREEQVQSS